MQPIAEARIPRAGTIPRHPSPRPDRAQDPTLRCRTHFRRGVGDPGVLVLIGWLLAAGCASPKTSAPFQPTGDPIADGKAMIDQGPRRDRVLWQYRTAAAALRRGSHADARALLDDALLTLQGIYGKDPEARRSRSFFRSEARKNFIGEPYERVMAYYYRGLLYWMDGEPDNARACFRSGLLMDSDTEDQTYAADYALLEYLEALVTARLGGDASDAFRRAQTVARHFQPAALQTADHVLFFVEFGRGPTKYADGQYQERLRFRPGASEVHRARITVADQCLLVEPWDDLSFQATTRGGRAMDHVLANKAVFKRTTDAAGTAAIISGAIMASQRNPRSPVDEVGAGLLAAGLIAKAFSAATTPAADTRTWENLPQYLAYASAQIPEGEHTLTIEFLDANDQPIAQLTRQRNLQVLPPPRDTVVFLSGLDR